MCSRHVEPGAGSEYVERPYRALIEAYDGDRMTLTVRAIGPRGAEATARQAAVDRGFDICTVLRVEEAA